MLTMLANDDVIDLMGQMGIFLVQQAVFASAPRASLAGTFGDPLRAAVRNVTGKMRGLVHGH
jgi:hypothetical protein